MKMSHGGHPTISAVLLSACVACGCAPSANQIPAGKPNTKAVGGATAIPKEPDEQPARNVASITNSIGMELVLIPSGSFRMGSPRSEKDREPNEDQVDVTFTHAFYLGRTEVTQREWQAVMETIPWHGKPLVSEGDDCPVVFVSWKDAKEFCEKLSTKEAGDIYRLPTDAEWEYACRGGTTSRFSFGDDQSRLGDYAWFSENSLAAQPVARKKPNPLGLFDMHGNVWEWCEDAFAEKPSAGIDPLQSSGVLEVGYTPRVYRGGAWNFESKYCRSAYRACNSEKSYHQGFRVARNIGE